jgi:hypothetical protein
VRPNRTRKKKGGTDISVCPGQAGKPVPPHSGTYKGLPCKIAPFIAVSQVVSLAVQATRFGKKEWESVEEVFRPPRVEGIGAKEWKAKAFRYTVKLPRGKVGLPVGIITGKGPGLTREILLSSTSFATTLF